MFLVPPSCAIERAVIRIRISVHLRNLGAGVTPHVEGFGQRVGADMHQRHLDFVHLLAVDVELEAFGKLRVARLRRRVLATPLEKLFARDGELSEGELSVTRAVKLYVPACETTPSI